jgi:hypothetical protein
LAPRHVTSPAGINKSRSSYVGCFTQKGARALIACIRNSNRLWASQPGAPSPARRADLVHSRGGFVISFCSFFFVNNFPDRVRGFPPRSGWGKLLRVAALLMWIAGAVIRPLFLDWRRQPQSRLSAIPDRLMRVLSQDRTSLI